MDNNKLQKEIDIESSLIPIRYTVSIIRLGGDEEDEDSLDYFNLFAFSEDEALQKVREAFEILQENILIESITKYFI